ncbi:MAG: hypothetical protein ACT4PE_11670, partial [Candidatus Eiseniibacteriota bacterium]
MMRTGRVLLVEPEDDLRRDLCRRFADAGHDAAQAADLDAVALLLREGFDPDIVVAREGTGASLRDLAPRAVLVSWLGAEPEAPERSRPERRRASVGPVSGEALLARVEEALLERRE